MLKTEKLGAEAVRVETGGVVTLTFPRLADPKVLKHAVSTRLGGVSKEPFRSLNVSLKVGDDSVRVFENRDLLSRMLGMDLGCLVYVNQIHGDKVLKLERNNLPAPHEALGEGDGLITRETGIPIAILVADCLPVLFYDPVHKAVGLAHAGWRGTLSHIAAKTLLAMEREYMTKPEEVRAVLGPCIGPCCYEINAEVKNEFVKMFSWGREVAQKSFGNRWKLDLPEANARQLLEIGMNPENLIRSELCTIQNIDLFYSHRAEATPIKSTGRIGSFMMLME